MTRRMVISQPRRSGVVSTSELAVWFGVTRKTILKYVQEAGVEPVGRGSRGVSLWPRQAAIKAVYGRVAKPR
ncbi:hypothetical protein RN607_00645 [Demequina capsici]|uniref:Helix-turn-helix domain-containing protein n=1 Tax=Demequina capsici TaxID=3075620 RepID=A0AA96JD11_9MICO|nr:hypothetical protein [Demequina sp. PMTSA13]WNM27541.1 hypothetical protein RN607_00645 [Demequina sp. PMTSA13]